MQQLAGFFAEHQTTIIAVAVGVVFVLLVLMKIAFKLFRKAVVGTITAALVGGLLYFGLSLSLTVVGIGALAGFVVGALFGPFT